MKLRQSNFASSYVNEDNNNTLEESSIIGILLNYLQDGYPPHTIAARIAELRNNKTFNRRRLQTHITTATVSRLHNST